MLSRLFSKSTLSKLNFLRQNVVYYMLLSKSYMIDVVDLITLFPVLVFTSHGRFAFWESFFPVEIAMRILWGFLKMECIITEPISMCGDYVGNSVGILWESFENSVGILWESRWEFSGDSKGIL